jgi:hypothetical protein
MSRINRKSEQGVSLLLAMLALIILTAVAFGMMYMSSTETAINSNFKTQEVAYFAARAGVEEARDRMLAANPNTIAPLLPTTLPPAGGGVLYLLQNGVTAANVTNVSPSNPLGDDEFCHDFVYGGMHAYPPNVRCTDLPSGGWYTTVASVAPYPLDYKWVRVTLKANNSTPYLVDAGQPVSNQVCWNGVSEVARPTAVASCAGMIPNATPVYLVTSLAVTASAGRRLVQQEIAQAPPVTPPNTGFFATGNGCNALTVAGNASTKSFNSAAEGTPTNPPSNVSNTNGNVGANGGVSVGGSSTNVNGTISTYLPANLGSCPTSGVTTTGSPGIGTLTQLAAPYLPPVPPLPNPLPPQTNVTLRNTSIPPGSYGNVTIQGTVTLTGGTVANPTVYTLNSLNFNGNANLIINGAVVINLAGVNQSTVLDMTGGSFVNNSYIPSNFLINYGGTGNMKVAGGTGAYAIINAPNSAISFHGGSDFYGAAVGRTIDDQGGTNLAWDTSLMTPPPVTTDSYYEISLRELSY